jgi:hypothetical protein
MDDLLVLGVLFSMLATSIAANIAGGYILLRVKPDAQKVGLNDYLRLLFSRDLQVAFIPNLADVVVIYTLLRTFWPELRLPTPPPGVFAIFIGVSMIVMRRGVIRDGLRFWRDRRAGGRRSAPHGA